MNPFLAGALALLPLVLEVFCLRWALHVRLGENLSVLGAYARDLWAPFGIGGLYALVLAQENELLKINPTASRVARNLLCFAAAFTWAWFAGGALFRAVGPEVFVSVLFLLLFLCGASALTVFVSGREVWRVLRGRPANGLFFFVAVFLLVIYSQIVTLSWYRLSAWTAHAVKFALDLVIAGGVRVADGSSFRVHSRHFGASINSSCAGWEGPFFFLFAFSVKLTLDTFPRALSVINNLLFVLGGVLVMIGANIFRIALFFFLGEKLEQHWHGMKGVTFFEVAFHENFGWILYLLLIGGMLMAYDRLAGRRLRPGVN